MFKPIRIEDQTVCCSVEDPAIDWDRMAEEQKKSVEELYSEFNELSLKDPSKAVDSVLVKSGQSLTRFVIGVIPSDVIARISDECRVGRTDVKFDELRWRAFLHGVKNIEGWPEKAEKVDSAWLSKTFVRGLRLVAMEIGLVVWRWNQLTGEEIKN